MKIKEQQIEIIFELIAVAKNECTGKCKLLGLLKAITKVNEFSIANYMLY